MFVTQDAEQGFGRDSADQLPKFIDNWNRNHVQPYCEACDIFLVISWKNCLVLVLHNVAN